MSAALRHAAQKCVTYSLSAWPVVNVTVHRAPRDHKEWVTTYLDPLFADLRRTQGPFVVVVDIMEGADPDARVRREHANYLIEHAEVYDRAVRTAVVVRTAIARGLATAINWFLPESKKMQFFATPEDAESWARQGLRGLR